MALTTNLQHYWNVDDNSGSTITDEGGAGEATASDMTITGATWGTDEIILDGTGDYATSANSTGMPSGTGDWSISLFVNPNEAATGLIWTGTGGTNERVINVATGDLRVFFGGADTGNLNNVIPTQNGTTYYHIVIVRTDSDDNLKTYVNTVLKDTQTNAVNNITAATTRIGASDIAADELDGRIKLVGIWNKALTTGEISELYNSGSGVKYPFAVDITLTPSALTLTTGQPNDDVIILASPLSLANNLALSNPTIDRESSIINGTINVGTGERGQKELKTNWPNEEGLTSGTQKQTGRTTNLVFQEGSRVLSRNKVLI